MKKLKNMVFLLLVLMTLVSFQVIASGGRDGARGTGAAVERDYTKDMLNPEIYKGKYDKPIKIQVACVATPQPDASIPNNSVFHQMILEDFGLDYEVLFPTYDGYLDRLKLYAATGEVPDVFQMTTDMLYKFAKEGVLAPTGEYYEKYPILSYYYSNPDAIRDYFTVDGKRYGLPSEVHWVGTWVPSIREDWLKALNLKIPTTFEEFDRVLYAFAKDDPDGNGKDDTYGLCGNVHSGSFSYGLMIIWELFGAENWEIVDGKWAYPGVTNNMKEAIRYLTKLYQDGVLEPETFVNTESVMDQKRINGVFGVFMESAGRFSLIAGGSNAIVAITQANPEASVIPFELPEPKKGLSYKRAPLPYSWHYQISAEMGKDQEKMDRFIRFVAWQTTTSGFTRINRGLPGVHFKEFTPEGYPVPFSQDELTDEIKTNIKQLGEESPGHKIPIKSKIWWNDPDIREFYLGLEAGQYGQQYVDANLISDLNKSKKRMPIKYKTAPIEAEVLPTLQTKFNEIAPKIIVGQLDFEKGWQEWLDFFNKNGGPELQEEVAKYNQ